MDQAFIDKLKAAAKLTDDTEARYERELQAVSDAGDALRAQCDHVYPDGKSAVEGRMFDNVCTICGASDY